MHTSLTFSSSFLSHVYPHGAYVCQNAHAHTRSSLGVLPIMVLSNRCRLRGKSALELQACKEEVNEFGGYFIVNGIERVSEASDRK